MYRGAAGGDVEAFGARHADLVGELRHLLARLQEWLLDATEQVMSPGRSNSTSMVRTAQYQSEERGLKVVARSVQHLIGYMQR